MGRLHRYIFANVLVASVASVLVFVFCLIAANLVRDLGDLLARGILTPALAFELIALLVPFTVAFGAPLGVLIGTLLVVGRLTARREVAAMRGAGCSLWWVARPVLAVGLVGTLLAAGVNLYLGPWARTQYKELPARVLFADPLRILRAGEVLEVTPELRLYAGEKEGTQLRNLWIWQSGEAGETLSLTRARTGEVVVEEGVALTLLLRDGVTELPGWQAQTSAKLPPMASFEEQAVRFELPEWLNTTRPRPKLSNMTLPQLQARRAQVSETWKPGAKRQTELARIDYYVSGAVAKAYAVLALATLAVPVALRTGRRESFANVGLGLLLAAGYYTATIAVDWLGDEAALKPALLVWLPNLLAQGVGLVALWRQNGR